jgi:hypothetical protein
MILRTFNFISKKFAIRSGLYNSLNLNNVSGTPVAISVYQPLYDRPYKGISRGKKGTEGDGKRKENEEDEEEVKEKMIIQTWKILRRKDNEEDHESKYMTIVKQVVFVDLNVLANDYFPTAYDVQIRCDAYLEWTTNFVRRRSVHPIQGLYLDTAWRSDTSRHGSTSNCNTETHCLVLVT